MWCSDYFDGALDVYMYDLSTKKETRISISGSAANPAIYGNRIVWEDHRNGNPDIYMYDLSTKKEKRITTNPSASYSPVIHGDRIAWMDDRNGNWDIYVYDLGTGQESHTTDKSDQYDPDIYGDRIVWTDMRNGNADIYMGTLSTSSPVKPIAAFSASPTSGNAPLKVQFTDKSTGSPTSWKWRFGDGKSSTYKSPAYTYSKAGKYTVSLTVKNAAGANTKTIKNYITVKTAPVKPIAAFSASPTSGKAPLKVQFTDKSTGSPTSWKWSFGDGTYSTARSPAHTYSKAGKYTVSLTVKNAVGTNTKTINNYIVTTALKAPGAAFSAAPTSGKAPLKVQFTDKSTGSPTSWKWNFGDGTYSTSKSPSHTYSKAGKYTVSLTVKNAKGSNTKTMSGYITVSKK